MTYYDFIIPCLSELIKPFIRSYNSISVLEIGPSPKSILSHLPNHHRSKIGKYVTFKPNKLFAICLKDWLCNRDRGLCLFPNWLCRLIIHQEKFALLAEGICAISNSDQTSEKFYVMLFCHSMYGIQPRAEFIRRAIKFLVELPKNGLVIMFYRDEQWDLAGLIYHGQATHPMGTISIRDHDKDLNNFSSFITRFT